MTPGAALIGRTLVRVERLGWPGHDPGVGPVHLVFDDGRGLLLEARSDWSLEQVATGPADRTWLDTSDYEWEGARWSLRDASAEPPFAAVIGLALVSLAPVHNEVGEVTGLHLDLGGHRLSIATWEGEVTTPPEEPTADR